MTWMEDWQKFHQKSFTVLTKTLGTMMRENTGSSIDFLKIDVGGSDCMLLQNGLDTFGCPPVRQIAV